MQIIHIIKVKQTKHGELIPIHYEDCPCYRNTKEKRICYDENSPDKCVGIDDGNAIKQVKDYYLLQCNYMIYYPKQTGGKNG